MRETKLPPFVEKAARRRRRLRSLAAAGSALALLGAVVAVVVTRGGEEPSDRRPSLVVSPGAPTPTRSLSTSATLPATGALPTRLVFSEGRPKGVVLTELDLRSGDERFLLKLPAKGIAMPRVGDWIAYNTVKTPTGDREPGKKEARGTLVLRIRNLRTGKEVEVPGLTSAWWSWDGSRLAARAPDGEIVTLTPTDPRPRKVARGSLDVVGWSGDRLAVFQSRGDKLTLIAPDGTRTQVPAPPGALGDPSPDGRWLFSVHENRSAVFQPVQGGDPIVVDLGPWQLGQAVWSGDGRLFAAVATEASIRAPSAVLVLDPARDAYYRVPSTSKAVAVFPARDGNSFVFARGKRPPDWNIRVCSLDGRCRLVGAIRIGAQMHQL